MISADNIVSIIRRLDLPRGQFVVGGSAVMVLAGIPREIGDLDVFCSTHVWWGQQSNLVWSPVIPDRNDVVRRCDPPYLTREMPSLGFDEGGPDDIADVVKVDLFYSWKQRGWLKSYDRDGAYPFIVQDFIDNPAVIRGVPTTGLQFVYDWKRCTRRQKDLKDVKLIERSVRGREGLLHPKEMEQFCAEAR